MPSTATIQPPEGEYEICQCCGIKIYVGLWGTAGEICDECYDKEEEDDV